MPKKDLNALRASVGELFLKSPGPAAVMGAASLGRKVQELVRANTKGPSANKKITRDVVLKPERRVTSRRR